MKSYQSYWFHTSNITPFTKVSGSWAYLVRARSWLNVFLTYEFVCEFWELRRGTEARLERHCPPSVPPTCAAGCGQRAVDKLTIWQECWRLRISESYFTLHNTSLTVRGAGNPQCSMEPYRERKQMSAVLVSYWNIPLCVCKALVLPFDRLFL